MKSLKDAEKKHFSQNGEDGVLEEIARRIFGENIGSHHIFEFGASSGDECNSKYFIKEYNWSATLVEYALPVYEKLRANYSQFKNVNALHALITPYNIQSLLNTCGYEVDVLSIDIDGQDYWVWEAVTSSPKVVIVEYNAALSGKKAITKGRTKPWDGTTAYGASLDAYIALGERKGYSFVHTESNGVNAFFIRNDFSQLFPEKDAPIKVGKNVANHRPTIENVFVEV